MASVSSFDIVSDFDMQELKNALDQTEREIGTRYDLKDTRTEIESSDTQLTITTNSEYTLSQVRDLLESKFVRRGLSLKILDYQTEEPASGARVRQVVKVLGMVNCAPGFNRTPEVIDGCSDLLVEVFGEAGRHTRSAVGLAELPFDIAVEIELVARLRA